MLETGRTRTLSITEYADRCWGLSGLQLNGDILPVCAKSGLLGISNT